jgi:recombination protein RecT
MAVQNSLQNTVATPTFSVFLTSTAVQRKINEVIGGKDGQRFMTQILSAVTNNPDLARCEQMSILNCAFLGEGLKLSPSPQLGQYYMVPFKDNNRDTTVATFVLGYKGYIQLAIRSGYYKKINVIAIKEGELVRYDPLAEDIEVNLIPDEEAREKAKTSGYYAMFEYTNGFRKTMYWSKSKMEAHAKKYSPAYAADLRKKTTYTFWSKDFDGMAYKTMLRQLMSKWGITSIELQQAIESDMTFQDNQGKFNYVESDLTEGQSVVADVVVEQVHVQEEKPQVQATQQEAEDDFFQQ